jgi:ADP-heptose:LPS heptosyltransferase
VSLRRTVVILHPGALGDLLLAVPAVQSLKMRFPAHELLLCGHDEGSRFLAECGIVDHSLSVQTTACTALFGGEKPDDPLLGNWLSRCDLAVAFTVDGSGALAGALRTAGAAAAVVQSPFASSLSGAHQSERFAEIVGVQSPSAPQISVPEALKAEAQEYCSRWALSPRRPFAFLHPGSGSRHKCVKPALVVPVLSGLDALGLEPVLIEGPADREIIESLLLHLPRRPFVCRGLPLRLVAGLLSQAELYLGHDSGVTHLAVLVGTPTVALFGPTDPDRWAPRGLCVAVVRGNPCDCPSWEAVTRCQEKPCLELSPSAILDACLTMRDAALNPRIC